MNNLEQFLNTLLADLDDLPVYVVESTKEYYESYFLDAKEEGLNELDILDKLGDPISISSQIKLDYYLYQPKQTNQVFKRLFSGVLSSKAALSTSKFFLGVLTFIFAAIFYILQLSFVLSAIAVLGAATYVIVSEYGLVFDTKTVLVAAAGLFGFSVFMILSIANKAISFWLRRVISNLIRKDNTEQSKKRKARFKPAFILYGILIVASLIIVITSPITKDLNNIWLSIEPENYEVIEQTFDPNAVNEIKIDVMHSNIDISFDDVDEIEVRYELASYFSFSYLELNNILYLTESSVGNIPNLEFFTRHEGTLDLTIIMPNDIDLNKITINSIGSNMDIDLNEYNLDISTETSIIDLMYTTNYDFSIETRRGRVYLNDETSRNYTLENGNDYEIVITGISTIIEGNNIEE